MFIRTILLLLSIPLSFGVARSQEVPTVESSLKSLDFSVVSVGVAKTKKGANSASHFVDVLGGFTLHSIVGCTITLRNEGIGRRRKFTYDAVIPLSELIDKGHVGQPLGGVAFGKPEFESEFFPWTLTFNTKRLKSTINLHDRVRRIILARGAHVVFGLRDRETLDKFDQAFRTAIQLCSPTPAAQ